MEYYEKVPTEDEQKTNIQEDSISWIHLKRQLLVISVPILNIFLLGICAGGPTVFIPQIRKEANSTEVISETIAPMLVSVYAYGAVPWVIILPTLVTYFGRKKPHVFVSVIMLIATISFYTSTSVTQMLISEVMESIANACTFTITSLVLTEYTSPRYRGFILTFKTSTLYWGVWVSNAIGTFFHWKMIGLVKVIISILPLILVFYWPESPYWLASKGRLEECAKSHRWLKGSAKSSEKELQRLLSNQNNEPQVNLKYITQKDFYKPLLIGFCSLLTSSFSGKFACSYYILEIIKEMTADESTAYTGMLIIDGVNILAMYTGAILARYIKRRSLFFSSFILGIVSLYLLSLYVYLTRTSVLSVNKYISLALLSLYSLGVGCGPILFSVSFFAELLPLRNRSLALCIAAIPKLIVLGALSQLTPIITRLGLHFTFLFFGVSLSICCIILYFFLPETKDKSLFEIADNIKGSKASKTDG